MALKPELISAGMLHSRTPGQRADWLVPLLIVCAVVLTFGRVISFQFVFDDTYLILSNPFIQAVANIPRFFTEHFWSGISIAQKNYYRPFSLLWLLANWKLFGAHPAGWHALSLLLHALNTLLVYLLALRLVWPNPGARVAAGAGAALFGLHPLQAEVVSWISCFNDLLASLLILASFHAWLNARRAPVDLAQNESRGRSQFWYAASAAGYACALLCKEPAALFPVVLLAFEMSGVKSDRTSLGQSEAPPEAVFRRIQAALLRLLPFLVVAGIYFALRQHALGSLTTPQARIISWSTEWLTLPSVLLAYLTHLVWPEGLSPFYDVPYQTAFTFWGVGLPFLAILLPVGLLVWAAWRSRSARFCAAWMALFAAPALHLAVLPRGELVHDRYLYLPMAGLSLLTGFGIAAVMTFQSGPGKGHGRGRASGDDRLLDIAWVAGALALALMLVAGRQAGFWRDNYTLFLRGILIAPSNGIAAGNLGIEYWRMGKRDIATALFQRAAELNPDIFEADKKAGYDHFEAGRYAEAEQAFEIAALTRPDDVFSHLMLGLIYVRTGRPSAGVAEGRLAVALAPHEAGYHFGLGTILEAAGDLAGARDAYRAELAMRPEHKPSRERLQRLNQILDASRNR